LLSEHGKPVGLNLLNFFVTKLVSDRVKQLTVKAGFPEDTGVLFLEHLLLLDNSESLLQLEADVVFRHLVVVGILLFEDGIYRRFCVHPWFGLASTALVILHRFLMGGTLSHGFLLFTSFKLGTDCFISGLELLRSLFSKLPNKSAFGLLTFLALEGNFIDDLLYFILFLFQIKFYSLCYLEPLPLFSLKRLFNRFHLVFTAKASLNLGTHQGAGALGVALDFI
jgi:hypothetical protein